MKFLFEFVSCCVPVNMSRLEIPEATAAPGVEEMKSLAPITTRKHRRRKRGALLPSAAKLAADWKPSLGAISEDKVVLVLREREKSDDQTAESERSVKRKSGSRDGEARGVNGRSNSNDFRRSPASIPVVIPAFSPTPFLF
ncbi:hypothetical protein SDJN02_23160 [Cucurbita argyrosperma subsp. argyrosperma]|nr:hypothetical protein SDJN02_23160 [Cucurbita argyrosperma subsp. argyrosperma]